MEFKKAMELAGRYLAFAPRDMDPTAPQGLWICDSLVTVSSIHANAVCMGTGCDWDDVLQCRPFFAYFPYIVIVAPNSIAREEMVKELYPRLSGFCVYVAQDAGFRGCTSMVDYIKRFGERKTVEILEGSLELPAYGLVRLADVQRRDLSQVPRTLSGFKRLDQGIGGFFAGELSVWTGVNGSGKSTILSQLLLESVEQGHRVCAYSGELPKEQFKEWTLLQAAGPDHITYESDKLTGKRIAVPEPIAHKQIDEWLGDRYWLFDLEKNTSHSPETILTQFEAARMQYGADVFLVDNIMMVDFDGVREKDFYREQSRFMRTLITFAKRRMVHVHLVVHPNKDGAGDGKLTKKDVGGSGDITNRPDNVFAMSIRSREVDGKAEQCPYLTILKNRDFGAKGEVWLDFDKKSRRYYQTKVGSADKRYGWDPSGQQLTLIEGPSDIDDVFPEDSK